MGVKAQIAGSHPRASDSAGLEEAPVFALFPNSQAMLMLLVQEPLT